MRRFCVAGVKARVRYGCAVALAVLVLAAAGPARCAEIVDRVLAVVSGTIITLSDVRIAMALGMAETTGAADPVAAVLTQLIERRLVVDEALRYGAEEPDFVSIEALAWAARRRFASDTAWDAARRRLGFTDETVRALAAERLMAEQFLAGRTDTHPDPTDDELRAMFDATPGAFSRDGRPLTFDEARSEVEARVRQSRRAEAAREWIGRLRRRADVSELYTPIR